MTNPKEQSKHDKAIKAARRFEIIPADIEYLDVVKSKTTAKRYKADEIAGMRWSDLQEKLYKDGIPPGTYTYTAKTLSDPVPYHGRIKSVPTGNIPIPDNKELNDVKNTINTINSQLKSLMNKGGDQVTVEFMIAAAERSHKAEISFYELQIKIKDETIVSLKGEIRDLEAELDKAEEIINKLKEEGGSGDTAKAILGLVNRLMPTGGSQPKIKLSEKFDGSDIPEDIIALLATVDYEKIPPAKLSQLKNGLTMIVQQLPLKAA